jgi:hypothetical protein
VLGHKENRRTRIYGCVAPQFPHRGPRTTSRPVTLGGVVAGIAGDRAAGLAANPQPVPRRVLDEDGDNVPGGVGVECRYVSHTTLATRSVSRAAN